MSQVNPYCNEHVLSNFGRVDVSDDWAKAKYFD